MRYGVHVSVTPRAGNVLDDLVEQAARATAAGLDFWVPQMLDYDAMTALAVVAREVPGAHVGTAVVPTYPRHPLALASQALTLAAAAPGRFVLGIGLSHQLVVERWYGLSYDRPVRHLREYLAVLLPTLRGEQVTVDGELVRADTHALPRSTQVPGAVPPPVLVAALGEQLLRVAGELADGTALWMVGPRTLEQHVVPTITRAAEAAGRPRPQIALGLPVAVTDDPAGARERCARAFGYYGALPSYRAMLDREGAAAPEDVAVIGDEATVTARLHELRDLGVTHLTIPLAGDATERRRGFELLSGLAAEGG